MSNKFKVLKDTYQPVNNTLEEQIRLSYKTGALYLSNLALLEIPPKVILKLNKKLHFPSFSNAKINFLFV